MEQIKDLLATAGHGLMVFCYIIMMLTSFNLCFNVLSNLLDFCYKNNIKFWLLMNFLNEVKRDTLGLYFCCALEQCQLWRFKFGIKNLDYISLNEIWEWKSHTLIWICSADGYLHNVTDSSLLYGLTCGYLKNRWKIDGKNTELLTGSRLAWPSLGDSCH